MIRDARQLKAGYLSLTACHNGPLKVWNRRIPNGTYGGVGGPPFN